MCDFGKEMEELTGVVVVMGACGSGKSSIAKLIVEKCRPNSLFIEGDDHHPEHNIIKISQGQPLNDDDREPWLKTIAQVANCNLGKINSDVNQSGPLVVISCSALKKKYRDLLVENIRYHKPLHFVLLDIPALELHTRINKRAKVENHFMPSSLVESQLNDLEKPEFDEGSGDRIIKVIEGDLVKGDIDRIGNSVIEKLRKYNSFQNQSV